MKRQFCLTLFLIAGGCMVIALVWAVLPKGRWGQLQRLGQVPEGAAYPIDADWRIAASTTWWGKPLDPKAFWKGRVIWDDSSAEAAAHRHGREFPPIPVHVPNLVKDFPLSSRSHKDIVPGPFSMGIDSGPVIPFHSTDAENAYWNWFWRTKPKPPATLEREQLEVAERSLPERTGSDAVGKRRAEEVGVPAEAMTDEALFWAYVMKQRQEYAKEPARAADLQSRAPNFAERSAARFLEGSAVDKKFITGPLTDDQIKAANSWKIAYLQRLRQQKVDESYIGAYLEAWNLSPADAFPKSKGE
jgi:hypothetical protein